MWILCFIKVVAFKQNIFFLHFLNLWSKAKLISLYRVDLFTFTPILRNIKWQLWTSIKVSHKWGKHLSICFLISLFFLQFAEFNLKPPPYSKTLQYSRISISHALPPFRSIYNQDCGNSSRGNVALKMQNFNFYYLFFFTIEAAIIKNVI